MPGDSEHPVTFGKSIPHHPEWGWPVPATVADLVSALRAEGVLVVERDILLRLKAEWYRNGMHDIRTTTTMNNVRPMTVGEIREAVAGFEKQFFKSLAEAQPFPPAGR